MRFDFSEDVAFVTGASAGIGRATASTLSEHGAYVVGLDLNAEPHDDGPVFDDVVKDGELVVGDVTSAEDVAVALDVAAREGPVSITVNNAGVGGNGKIHEISPEDWQRTLAVHVEGTYNVCRVLAPSMADRGSGAIVNVGSIAGIRGYPATADYAAAKGAITSLTRQLAVDYSRDGVRVNAVAPGFIQTSMNEAVWKDRVPQRGIDYETATNRTLLPRLGVPEDVAEAIAYLVSDAASFITGHTLPVDGGWTSW
ncbi:SDR family NAD(P)-dependent oxidoreductase [Natronosalvus rutilus]|uniref:SDR family oxidoreductase n=1 Tax=Natronosalvus rutilus TaxID=2953753 RepID=A0A9E7NE46_9EURY|nr:SDR family oxidoreductase [Natronosalvus rutilus]UTF55656.1 SDR family oxidoreductase [Natronosalvus rutilus]